MAKKDALVDQSVVDTKTAAATENNEVKATRVTYGLPDNWTDAQVKEWDRYSDKANYRTQAGSWVYDPTRPNRKVATWSNAEIEDWVMGLLNGSDAQGSLMDAIVRRYVTTKGLNATWTSLQIITYVRTGIAPALTTRQNPIVSTEREKRAAKDWSDSELEDWIDGEITGTEVAPDSVLALEAKVRFNLPDEANTVAEVRSAKHRNLTKAVVATNVAGISEAQIKAINDDLVLYYERVKPRMIVTDQDAQIAQVGLDRLFSYVLSFEGQAFVVAMDTVRVFVKNHIDDVFSPEYAFRFVRFVSGSQKTRQRHLNLISAFQLLASSDPQFLLQQDLVTQFQAFGDDNAVRLQEYFIDAVTAIVNGK